MNQPHPRSLHIWALETIGHDIAAGKLPAGAPINLDELTTAYRLSRGTLREVVRVLTDKKMIVSRHGVGTRVQPPEQWNLLDADVLRWRRAAALNEDIDQHIEQFAQHAQGLRLTLAGNVLYQQLTRNLAGDAQREEVL